MRAFLILACLLCGLSAARADQTDPRLNPLFEALASSTSFAQAQRFERVIWVLWLDHDDATVMERMSVSSLALGEGLTDAALEEVNAVIEWAPDYAEGWNRRATIAYMQGRYVDSLSDIDRVLELEPRHFGALSGKGLCLMALGRYEEAELAFRAALAIHPHMPGAKRNLDTLKDLLGKPI
ncbi:MAG: tetratricopeptide repeat protein [Pseudomonadota bacterium]